MSVVDEDQTRIEEKAESCTYLEEENTHNVIRRALFPLPARRIRMEVATLPSSLGLRHLRTYSIR